MSWRVEVGRRKIPDRSSPEWHAYLWLKTCSVCGWVGLWCSHASFLLWLVVQEGQRSPQSYSCLDCFLFIPRLGRRKKTSKSTSRLWDTKQEGNMFWWSLIFWEKAQGDSDHELFIVFFLEKSKRSFIWCFDLVFWIVAQEDNIG